MTNAPFVLSVKSDYSNCLYIFSSVQVWASSLEIDHLFNRFFCNKYSNIIINNVNKRINIKRYRVLELVHFKRT